MWCPPIRLKSNVKPSGKLVSPYDALAVMGKIGKSFSCIFTLYISPFIRIREEKVIDIDVSSVFFL
jgi:hypothetical protein